MKQGLTHLIFVVDRSGSMEKIRADMIGGFNSFIEKQKLTPGECVVSFYQFDHAYETVYEHVPLLSVVPLTTNTFVPRGMTHLYDALTRTITSYGNYLSGLPESSRPERVSIITITDGEDNSLDRESKLSKLREMVIHQTDKYKWDFVFLGSNIDAWSGGSSLGIDTSSTLQFAANGASVITAFGSLSDATVRYRMSGTKTAYSFTPDDVNKQDDFLPEDQKQNK